MDLEELKTIIGEELGPEYQNIRLHREGGTAYYFIADWTLDVGTRKRSIKVDKPPEGPRAERHRKRGCDTRNQAARMFRLKDAAKHNLNSMHGFRDLRSRGWDGNLMVEDFFESQTLEERVRDNGKLSIPEFEKTFSQVLVGEQYLIRKEKLYHRDLKPSNILINDEFETRITDLANARSIEDLVPDVLPTAGGHFVMDPRLIGRITGRERAYDERAELYAIGINMLYGLTGKYWFEYDPDEGTGIRLDTGASILDSDGTYNSSSHNEVMHTALNSFNGDGEKYKKIIERCITGHENDRYKSVDELVRDFERAHKPGFWQEMAESWRQATAAVALAGLGAAGLAWFGWDQEQKKQEALLADASRPGLSVTWEGDNLEATNNLFEMHTSIDDEIVQAKPGERILFAVYANEGAFEKRFGEILPKFPIEMYFEGVGGKETFRLRPGPADYAWQRTEPRSSPGFARHRTSIEVPDVPDGLYILRVDALSLTPEELREQMLAQESRPGTDQRIVDLRMPGTRKVAERERIRVLVGEPDLAIDVDYLNLIQNKLGFERIPVDGETYTGHDLRYVFSLPEEGTLEREDNPNTSVILTDSLFSHGTDEAQNVLSVGVCRNKELAFSTYIPVRRRTTDERSLEEVKQHLRKTADPPEKNLMYGYSPTTLEREAQAVLDGANRVWRIGAPDASVASQLFDYRRDLLDKCAR